MKNVMKKIKNYPMYLGMLFLAFSLVACSDDDDGILDDDFTGTIIAMDQTISENIVMVQTVSVGQDSWLVAVHDEEADSDNFIADPLFIEEGTMTDISLLLDADANLEDSDEIVLKLYAEDDDGIFGEWDIDDEPITDEDDVVVSVTIMVIMEGSFSSFDANNDDMLDSTEVPNTYQNNFEEWDADGDGVLNDDEFYSATFWNTDADDDNMITEAEWNTGYSSLYGVYVEDDYATYDADADGFLDYNEWNDAFADSLWYDTYDADDDGFVADTEWDTGLFNDWDLDDDTFIDEDEFNNYVDYVTFW